MEIEDDERFHQREWRAQRCGRIGLGLVVLAAVTGLFGGGRLSHARLEIDAARVEYERILRWRTSAPLSFVLPASAPIEVVFDAEYVDLMSLRAVQPVPETIVNRSAQRVFRYTPPADGLATLAFEITPIRPGLARTFVDAGGIRTELSHLILF